jgi:uncharacterized membrane protein YccC
MASRVAEPGWSGARPMAGALSAGLPHSFSAAVPPLLFGLRLWASVCLALYVAFWLQLDNPFWAGTSAAVVCQPQLGASLRKGWFRMIGTLVGATMIVALTACFSQDRFAFLGLLALWGSLCAFAATVLRNFASYAAALAGYTAAIIAADTLGATGGASPEVFMLAVTRASEICIGIVCAGLVLAGTDFGDARRQLAASFAALAAQIATLFAGMLARAASDVPDTHSVRSQLAAKVIALDPVVDQAIGESSELNYQSPVLQRAIHGLFTALDGWRGVAGQLPRSPGARREAASILRCLPREFGSSQDTGALARRMANPLGLRGICERVAQVLLALPAPTPSQRLIADQTAKLLTGIAQALDGLALLVGVPVRPRTRRFAVPLTIPDWLPALVNGARAFITISLVEIFWVLTAWPTGGFALIIVANLLLLLGSKGDLAYAGALAAAIGSAGSILFAAIIKFAALPAVETFGPFCLAIGLFYLPVGFVIARTRKPAVLAVFTVMALTFMPLLAPKNQMSYDTAQFYNFALAVLVGCGAAALSFRLLPSVSPTQRTRRLLTFALADLRRSAVASLPPTSVEWQERMYGRLAALPDNTNPSTRAELLAVLDVGSALVQLREAEPRLALRPELDDALAALADGRSAMTRIRLGELELRLASLPDAAPGADLALRARASILAISEALAQHSTFFDAGAPT